MLLGNECIFKLCDFGTCGTLKDSISSTHLGSMRYLPVRNYFLLLLFIYLNNLIKSLNVSEMFVHIVHYLICGH